MIRAYRHTDMEDVLNIWYEVARSSYRFLPVETIDLIKQDIKEKYIHRADTWVAVYDDCIVGFISLIENIVGGLFVLPSYQNMSIGKELVSYVKNKNGSISLDILKENSKVLKFYEKCGFVPTKEGICPITSLKTITVELV
jgi:putative acetyltransferase